MSELLTASITIVAGIVIYVSGQIFVVLFLERIRMQARTIEEIAVAIVVYGREYSSPVDAEQLVQLTAEHRQRLESASDEIRRLSARLRATASTLRYYGFFERIRLF